jgi:hypothetical protein
MTNPVSIVSEFFARDMSKSHTIKSCEVRGYFTGDDDIVGSECVVRRWERDFDECRSEVSERFLGLFDDFTSSRFDTISEIFFWQTNSHSLQIRARPDISGDFDSSVEAGRIERIVTLHCIPDSVAILDSASDDAHRIKT